MNRKQILLLCLAAVGCIALLLFYPADGLAIIALPFTLIGNGLRRLSLSGATGNIIAIGLYVLLGLAPMLLLPGRKWQKENILIPLASVTALYSLYYMVNPGLRPVILNNQVGDLIYAGTVYSMVLAWGIIKLLRYCDKSGVSNIYQALRIFLMICAAGCVLMGFGVGLRSFRTEIAAIAQANTDSGLNLMPTYVFRFLAFAATALEYTLDALVMWLGVRLLGELEKDAFSDGCCAAAEMCTLWCKRAMVVIMLANMALNLGQLFLAPSLHSIDSQFRLPVGSMAIVFSLLALSRLLSQGKALKEDNELFI